MWNDEREMTLDFPEEWDLTECRMGGHGLPPLSPAEIQRAFENPIGTPHIEELARGKKRIAILFDDTARPTPVYQLLPFVFEGLKIAGVSDDQIRLICALGCHRPLDRDEMIKKLGREVVERFSVFNHNVFEHHVDLGVTRRGTRVLINREVASCDLKIGIGSIIPHFTAGFGGGAKILLPGVSSIDTVARNHIEFRRTSPHLIGLGKIEDNPVRLDMEEAARMAGLDLIINVVVDHRRNILGVFVGDVVEAHRRGVARAKEVYGTESKGRFDLMVINAFPIEESPKKALWPAKEGLQENGDVVLVWQSAGGRHPHYLLEAYGSDYGGRRWEKPGSFCLPRGERLFIYTESISKVEKRSFGPEEKVLCYRDWQELVNVLKSSHGKGSRVAIYPYATLQCPMIPDEPHGADMERVPPL